jgi:hypothetical protein
VPVIKTTQELKDFVLWAKEAGIKSFKIADLEVCFSDLALNDATYLATEPEALPTRQTEERDTSKTIVDELINSNITDDEDLFWSSKS